MDKQRTIKCYISGPIRFGDPYHNFNPPAEAQRILMEHGIAVHNPMLTIKLPDHWASKITLDAGLRNDFPWIRAADCVLRLH